MSLVGKNIDAFCSRCGFTLTHVVLYEMGGVVRGVKCKTCRTDHRYRGPAPAVKRVTPAVRLCGSGAAVPRPKAVRPVDSRQWEAKRAAMAPDAVVWDYKWTERYEKGDAIAHSRFGVGFIESVTMDDMEVLFQEGRKRMAMNRPETIP